jgi:aspartate/tyrosine/aromatic aminotransferase
MAFERIPPGVPDPMYDLKKRADSDTSRLKVDLGVGIYRNEAGVYQELDVVKQVSLAQAKDASLTHRFKSEHQRRVYQHRQRKNWRKLTAATMYAPMMHAF